MKRKHQRTLDLIFSRPVSANVRWADIEALFDALSRPGDGRPVAVIANTTKGKGVSFIEGGVEWHHKVPSAEQVAQALEELA